MLMWITHLDGAPKRVNHAAVAVGHKIYSFGGYCTGENSREYCSMDVHVLNTSTYRWTKHPVSDLPYFENDDILPYKRYGHTAVLYKDKIYIWGGRNDRASCAVLFCFDPVWHCWTAPKTSGDIPPARDGHSAGLYNNKMYIFGGYEDDMDAFSKSVYCLDLESMYWTQIHTNGTRPSHRDFHSCICMGDRMYIFGGRGTEERIEFYTHAEVYCNELWYLDLRTYEWVHQIVEGEKPVGRRSHSAFLYNDKMFIFGGYNALLGKHYNDLQCYDPKTNRWQLLKPRGDPPCMRRRQACIVMNNRMFLFGGTSPLCQSYHSDELPDDKLVDHSDMFVLDFSPSLKTLCFIAVKKHKLSDATLPQHLRVEYLNMFTSSKPSPCRPSNSAG